MSKHIKVAIFASGSGSNAENIIKFFASNETIIIDSIYTNKSDAFVVERAKKLNVDCFYFSNADFKSGTSIIQAMKSRNIEFIVLAGFLLKIPQNIIELFPNKIINIHPALLPKYGGKGMYGNNVHQAVKEANEIESGITIHYVNEHYDEGKCIFQAKCKIENTDSAEIIAGKIHELEFKHFPEVIKFTIVKSFELEKN